MKLSNITKHMWLSGKAHFDDPFLLRGSEAPKWFGRGRRSGQLTTPYHQLNVLRIKQRKFKEERPNNKYKSLIKLIG